jgi:hypothetical protein
MVAHPLGCGDHRLYRHPGKRTAHADPPRAGLGDLGHRQVRSGQHVDRPRHGLADGTDLRGGAQAGRVQNVGAGALVRQ